MFDHFVGMVLKGLRDWQGPEYTSGDNERDNAIFIVDSRQIMSKLVNKTPGKCAI